MDCRHPIGPLRDAIGNPYAESALARPPQGVVVLFFNTAQHISLGVVA
jgi:hypothetical protein